MVDRIVPATTDADRDAISVALGLRDAWPVVAEPYFRFVIEDRFPHGRPKLEKSGVEFVGNVEPYEHMKLRMLNGSHSAIAAIGQIASLATVADAWGEKTVRDFIDAYWREVGRTLDPVVDGAEFAAGLRERFANPSLQHKTMQIASDASQKVPLRILAPLRELLEENAGSGAVILPWPFGSGPARTGTKRESRSRFSIRPSGSGMRRISWQWHRTMLSTAFSRSNARSAMICPAMKPSSRT